MLLYAELLLQIECVDTIYTISNQGNSGPFCSEEDLLLHLFDFVRWRSSTETYVEEIVRAYIDEVL